MPGNSNGWTRRRRTRIGRLGEHGEMPDSLSGRVQLDGQTAGWNLESSSELGIRLRFRIHQASERGVGILISIVVLHQPVDYNVVLRVVSCSRLCMKFV